MWLQRYCFFLERAKKYVYFYFFGEKHPKICVCAIFFVILWRKWNENDKENDKDTVYMSWQYLPVGDGRNGDETFVQKCR